MSVAVATVLESRGIVPVVCAIVLLKGREPFMRALVKAITRPVLGASHVPSNNLNTVLTYKALKPP